MQQSFIALALAGLAFCTPIRRDLAARDLVMVTKYATVVETDVVYSTVWVDPTSVETATATVTPAAVETTPTAVAPAVTPAVTPAAAPPAAATTSAISQSAAQAPAPVQPSSSAQAATTPAPAPVAPPAPSAPTSSSAAGPAPAPPSTGGKGGPAAGTTATGQITYYDVGLGACGETSTADQPVVAISKDVYDQYGFSNSDPVCGRKVAITYDGQTKEATVVDRCVGCAPGDLDLSRSLFESLAGSLDKGRISGVQWKWM